MEGGAQGASGEIEGNVTCHTLPLSLDLDGASGQSML